MARKTGVLKSVLGAAAVLALSSIAALAATFAQPPTVDIQAPASVQQGHQVTVTGTVSGTGSGTTVVTVVANGVKQDGAVSFAVESTTPTPFVVKFHVTGNTGDSVDITATAVGQDESGPLIAVDTARVQITHGRSGK